MMRAILDWLRLRCDMGGALGPRHGRGYGTTPFAAAVAALVFCIVTPAGADPGGPIRLVALGDSLSAGYRLPNEAAFPAVLERMLEAKGEAVRIVNAGVSGDTSTGGLDRVDWSVPAGTDGVILELGANDMLRGIDPTITEAALSNIIERLRARKIPVLLAGMLAAPNLGPDYKARFDAIYPALAKRYGLTLYPFFLDGIMGDRSQHLDDGLHPNTKGVETIAARMLPTVVSFLDRLRQGASR